MSSKIKFLPQKAAALLFGFVGAAALLTGCTEQSKPSEVIRLAVVADYRPYVYSFKGGLEGIDIDIARMIAQETGRRLEFSPVTFTELVESVSQKKADMAMSALAVTEERRKLVEFSDPYEFAAMTILVRAGENIRHLPDMLETEGFRVGAEEGSTAYELIDRGKSLKLIGYPGNREAVAALLNHKNDAVALDEMVAVMMTLEYPGQLQRLGDKLNHEEFAVAVAKGDKKLLEAANKVIHRLWESGELEKIQHKHARQAMQRSMP